ncbi:MAG TPA: ATP-binding protein [Stellaceae bacterium]|nr:ATP-binding protein [Stellaceae bacterium]
MLVDEILDRKGRHVHEVGPDWPVSKAAAMLATWNVGTTLVTDFRGAMLGIISERDIVRSLNEFGGSVLRIRVRDLMTRSVITCVPETEIREALSLMASHRIRHLPVVRGHKIHGIISIRDVLKFRIDSLEESFTALVRSERESTQARAEAERANRAKTEFLAHMSHELRTPLNAIIGFSDLIANEPSRPNAAAANRQYAAHINTAGRHLLGLVNEVLDLSKVISGQLELDEAAVDLAPLLRDCVELMGGELAEKRLTLRTAVAVGNLSLTADGARLKQVLLNLLSNAVKFSYDGSAIEMRAEFTGADDLTIAITDHGSGMKPEHIPIALEPFRHIDGNPLHANNGTGIGLPLAKMLIEKHGGTLNVISELGDGTSVSITLPGWRINWDGAAQQLEVA